MSEQTLEASLIEMLPHAVVVLADGRVRLANPAFEKLVGKPLAELAGRAFEELLTTDSSGFGLAVLGGDPATTTSSLGKLPEYEIVRPDGQRRWVSVAARFVPPGPSAGLMLVLTDLTRLRHLEEVARRSHKAVETMRLGVTIADPAGHIIYVNPAQAELCGTDPGQLCGREARTLAPRELWRPWPSPEPEHWHHFTRESVNLRSDGSTFPVQLTSDTIRDAEGRLIGRVTICEDLTERKAAEEELRRAHAELEERVRQRTSELQDANELLRREIAERRRVERDLEESERRYRTLAEDLDEVVFSLDAQGHVAYVSPVIERLTGFRAEDLKGRSFAVLAQEGDEAALRGSLARTRAGSRQLVTVEMRTRGGQTILVRVATVPTLQGDAVVGVRGILTDVTERRRLEDQLLRAQKLEAVGRLAGGVAHDINNLLQGILATVESLQSRQPEAASELAEMVSHIKRGAAITRQLLLFARRSTAQPECLDLNDALQRCTVLLRRLTPENIDLAVLPASQPVLVEIDRSQLEQVLMNLVINAIDAMPGGGSLRLTTGRSEGSSWFEVADSGCGMSPEVKAHMYEPFFTTKSTEKGTGLGLPVVLGIVTGHQGRIEVTSEVGSGTTIRVILPYREAAALPPIQVPVRPPAPRRPDEVTVLVVEDDPLVRQAIGQALRSLGYAPTLAATAREALSLAGSARFGILLTDLMLPDLRGEELARSLREHDTTLPVILMSGYAQDEQGTTPVLGEAHTFLQKPFDLDTLAQALRRALSGG